MNNYTVFADSGCDLAPDMLNQLNVKCVLLTFKFDDSDKEYTSLDMGTKEFYSQLRSGRLAKTSAVNTDTFEKVFKEELQKGNDILYIAFSSGLSTTYHMAKLAAEELKSEFPDRKIIIVDSLCASAGHGLLVYLAVQEVKKGATLEEIEKFLIENRLHICHWFTVDDLNYLKKGGRVSASVALVGGILGIKPVLHVDDEGHLINVSKARGKKATLKALAQKYGELALDKQNGTVFISHGDAVDDALELEKILKEEYKAQVNLITDIGPVIGAHSGPGTLALFFLGKNR